MLIPSPRLREADMPFWSEDESADLMHARRRGLDLRIARSTNALRAFLASGPAYVAVSWGKDSVVTAWLALLVRPDLPLVNLRCSNRNPDCDAVRDAFLGLSETRSRYVEIDVDYGDLHRRFVGAELDRETDKRWHAGIAEAERRFGLRHILGVRADESAGRRARCARWGENSPNGCAPLAWWSTADVFACLAAFGLPVHPAYAMNGAGRWPRDRIRTAEIGDVHGTGGGRREWEREYYGDIIRRLQSRVAVRP